MRVRLPATTGPRNGFKGIKKAVSREERVSASELSRRLGMPREVVEAALLDHPDIELESVEEGGDKVFRHHRKL